MIRVLFTVSIFLISAPSFSCKLETYANFIFLKKQNQMSKNENYLHQVFKKTDCSLEKKQQFVDYLSNAQGTIHATRLEKYLDLKAGSVHPSRIKIHSLQGKLSKEIDLKENFKWVTTSENSNQYILGYDNEDNIKFFCNNCHRTGTSGLKIIHTKANGQGRIYWLKGKLLAGVKGYVATRDIPPHQTLKPKRDFIKKLIYTEKPHLYSVEDDLIKYSKLSRAITTGSSLKNNQLLPLNLVKAGSLVNLRLKHKTLSLSLKATAISSGKLNDSIRVRNIKSGRIVQGKVIDFNKIEVEL